MSKTLVILDDEPAMHVLIKQALAPLGCAIVDAYDGEEALSLMSRVKPDLLVVDLTLPRMDGWTFIREYRELTKSKTPVVVLTARAGFIDKMVLRRMADVNAYLTKPFEPGELRTIIKGLLEKGKRMESR